MLSPLFGNAEDDVLTHTHAYTHIHICLRYVWCTQTTLTERIPYLIGELFQNYNNLFASPFCFEWFCSSLNYWASLVFGCYPGMLNNLFVTYNKYSKKSNWVRLKKKSLNAWWFRWIAVDVYKCKGTSFFCITNTRFGIIVKKNEALSFLWKALMLIAWVSELEAKSFVLLFAKGES